MNRPHRILLLDQFGTIGGGQRVLCGVVRRAVERGWAVATATPAGPLSATLTRLGAEWYPLTVAELTDGRKGAQDFLRYIYRIPESRRQFRRLVEEVQPDLVHVNGGRVLAAVAGSTTSAKVCYHAHTLQDAPSALLTRGLLAVVRPSSVIVPSAFMARWVVRHLGVSSKRIAIVENWVDPQFTASATDTIPQSVSTPVGVVGRVREIKGQADALKAVMKLRTEGLSVELLLAGVAESRYKKALLLLAARDPEAVRFLGHVTDVPDLMTKLAVAVVPSLCEETFGLAAVEAMASGVPVIAYRSGALAEVIGDAGVLVRKGDVEGLATAIRALAEDSPRRRELARLGRERVRERFDYALQADKMLAVFEQVMED